MGEPNPVAIQNARDIQDRFIVAAGNRSNMLFGNHAAEVLNRMFRANGATGDIVQTAGIGTSIDPQKVVIGANVIPGREQEFADVVRRMGGDAYPDSESNRYNRDMRFDAAALRQHIQTSFPQVPADRPANAIKGLAPPRL